jgi:ABC-type glycerol-3-phosphate transport system substrate-binding protein
VQVTEWLNGYKQSKIIDPVSGNVTAKTLNNAEVLQKIASWADSNIINPADFSLDNYVNPLTSPPTTLSDDPVIQKFVEAKAIFIRHWASSVPDLSHMNIPFEWGVMPVIGMEPYANVGALGGWNVGVYRYAANPAGALKVVKWLTSPGVQRSFAIDSKLPVLTARPDFYDGMKIYNF